MEQPNENRIIDLPNIQQRNMFVVKDNKFYRPNALEKCLDRSSITREQYSAGLILFEDAVRGLITAGLKGIDPTKATMPRQKGYKPSEMTADQAYAHRDWSNAFHNERLGNVQRDILWHVVIMDNSISSFAENRNYTIGLLRETLNELIRIYKIMRKI